MAIAWSWLNTQNLYYVQLYTGAGNRPWELLLDNRKAQGAPKTYTGVLARSSKEYYLVRPVNRMEINGKPGVMPFGSAGFEVVAPSGKTLAAVSLLEKGTVYLGDTSGEERLLLATLCAALLLQEQIG